MPILNYLQPGGVCSLLFLLTSCSPNAEPDEYPNGDLLWSVEQLNEQKDDPSTVIVDMREEGYSQAHIPGAVHIEGVAPLHDPDQNIDAYLIDQDAFAELMGSLGIDSDTQVVIYDEGNSLFASRLFYALDVYGSENKHILNGGFAAWQEAEKETSDEPPEITETTFSISDRTGERMCDAHYISERLEDDDFVIFDARSAEEHHGEDVRTQFAGHIPGAVHLEWNNALADNDIPYFKTANELEQMLNENGITPDKEVVSHCHTNVRGSHAYFTLRLMGYDSVRAYEGSWSEYGETEGLPVE